MQVKFLSRRSRYSGPFSPTVKMYWVFACCDSSTVPDSHSSFSTAKQKVIHAKKEKNKKTIAETLQVTRRERTWLVGDRKEHEPDLKGCLASEQVRIDKVTHCRPQPLSVTLIHLAIGAALSLVKCLTVVKSTAFIGLLIQSVRELMSLSKTVRNSEWSSYFI